MLFSYKSFTFSQLFSQHPNKFYYKKFQNHSQITIHRTNHSQILTPHITHHRNSNSTHSSKLRQSKATTTKTPLPHHHNNKNQNHTEREIGGSKIDGSKIGGSKALGRRRDRVEARSSGVVWSAWCCDRRDRWDLVRAIVGLELGVRRWRRKCDMSSLFFLSLSLSLSLSRSGNHLKWK